MSSKLSHVLKRKNFHATQYLIQKYTEMKRCMRMIFY